MKQKIVIKVQVNCDKCRAQAMEVASVEGVESVSLQGADKDQLVVIGDGVDSICLTKRLRKKLRHAKIITVEEVKDPPKEKEKEKVTVICPVGCWCPRCQPQLCRPCPPVIVIEDSYGGCSIM